MKTSKKMIEQARLLLRKRGQKAFEIAKNAVLGEKALGEMVYDALRYFMHESWYDVQHPALISLTCEAVGGNPNATEHIGASMVLLAEIVLNVVKQAFLEIGEAEAQETKFKGRYDISPEDYYSVIEMKASVAEAVARIGAIIGGGKLNLDDNKR